MAILLPFLLAGILLILFKIGYYRLGLSILCHPVCAGIIFWLFTGDLNLLLASVFFELLWLDLYYVGTYVPPDGLFAYLLFAPLLLTFGFSDLPVFCWVLLLCLPCATMAGKLETRFRLLQSRSHEELNRIIDECGDIYKANTEIVHKVFYRFLTLSVGCYFFCALVFYCAIQIWLENFGPIYCVEWINWSFLLCLSALGGMLALRIPLARVCFVACVIVIGGLYIF